MAGLKTVKETWEQRRTKSVYGVCGEWGGGGGEGEVKEKEREKKAKCGNLCCVRLIEFYVSAVVIKKMKNFEKIK